MKWNYIDIRKMTEEEYQKEFSLMTFQRQERVNRYRFIEDRKRSVAGEILARKMVSGFCGVNPESIFFETGKYGKPYAKDLPVEFSISHSGDFAVCAVSDSKIGIDIEKIRPVDLKIAKRICTEKELLYILGTIPKESDFCITEDISVLTRFFHVWTKKEAYSKYLGNAFVNSETDMHENIPFLFQNEYIIAVYPHPVIT